MNDSPVKLVLSNFVKSGNVFRKKYKWEGMYTERRLDKIKITTVQVQLLGQSKEKINLLLLAKFFLNYGGRIEAKVFSSQYKPSPIPSGGLEIPLVLKVLIFEEKAAVLKHLPNFNDLNYEESTSMDTTRNELIVEEELRQYYNPEDEHMTVTTTLNTVFNIFLI